MTGQRDLGVVRQHRGRDAEETSQGKYREGAGPIILEDRKEGIKIILTGTKLIGPGLSSWYESSDQ